MARLFKGGIRLRLIFVLVVVVAIFGFFKMFQSSTHQTKLSGEHDWRGMHGGNNTSNSKQSVYVTGAHAWQGVLERSNASKVKLACVHPQLDPNDPQLMSYFHHEPNIKCQSEVDWIYTQNGQMKISRESIQSHGNISCQITFLKRTNDLSTEDGNTVTIDNDSPLQNDFFKVKCNAKDGKTYDNIHCGVAYKPELHKKTLNEKVSHAGLGLDILILGFDSLSRMTFTRKLPKSYDYIVNNLEAHVLKGYNIVGDGTPQALIPILTGKTELELPRTLKRLKNAPYVDVYPMIWNDLRNNGYVTAWNEDQPRIGTFTFRMTGFKEPPVDHYARPFHIAAVKEQSKHKSLCYGSRRRTKVFLDWLKEFYVMYKNQSKFAFGFHSEVSHKDANMVETADDDIVEFLSSLKNGGYLNNTVLMVMSDHGARFSNFRKTIQGKLEERLPFVSFVFPKWFYRKHSNAMKNFKTNTERLSTPFDLHSTLLDMLNFGGDGQGDTTQRGISLFKEIPESRTCRDADIELHWCACQKWTTESLTEHKVKKAATSVVLFINKFVGNLTDKCATLNLDTITTALSLRSEQDFLKFKQTNDADGYRADLTDNTQAYIVVYQITFVTIPGKGLFEATTEYNTSSQQFSLQESDISRINSYGDDPRCVSEAHEELRKYCFCI